MSVHAEFISNRQIAGPLVRQQHDAAARDYLLGVPCARTHVSSSSCCSGFSFKAIGLLLMRPLNHLEIDLSSYFSANTLG